MRERESEREEREQRFTTKLNVRYYGLEHIKREERKDLERFT